MRDRYFRLEPFLLSSIFLITLSIWFVVYKEDRGNLLRVEFLDVGQGDAIIIDTPSGNQVLIDGGGTNGAVLRELGRALPFYDRHIDVVVSTHPDQDHLGGLPEILRRYDVDFILESGVEATTNVYKAWRQATLDEVGAEKLFARRAMTVDLGDGVFLSILFPDRPTDGWETNTASIVAMLQYGRTSFMLTGDSPQAIEKFLASTDRQVLSANVLKVSHHGSRTSSAFEFISAVKPEYAVISAGRNNSYGHPHKETIDTLNKFGVKILRTDEFGTIVIKSDGQNISLEN
jgi:competence protein ComEC